LVQKTDGYSGADIEGVVKEAIETAFTQDRPELTTDLLLNAINNTASLSEIMKDSIQKMAETYKKNKFKNASIN
jgi:SpoVK/Ycf46/Vps4 family AAA+-type ATPase